MQRLGQVSEGSAAHTQVMFRKFQYRGYIIAGGVPCRYLAEVPV